MNRTLAVGMLAAAALGASGCANNADPSRTTSDGTLKQMEADEKAAEKLKDEMAAEEQTQIFTQDDVAELVDVTDGDSIKGAKVERVVGRVFQVQRDKDGVAVQMWTRPDDSEGNLIAILPNGSEVEEDDYLQISGEVYDVFTGENSFGGEVQAPRIAVDDFDVVDATALDPPIKTYGTPKTKALGSVTVTIQKIEITKKQTRVYVRYRNGSSDDFYGSPSLVADGDQVEDDYSSDVKGPASSVSPGASSSGVLVFEPIDPDAALRLTFDGTFDANYNEITATFSYGS